MGQKVNPISFRLGINKTWIPVGTQRKIMRFCSIKILQFANILWKISNKLEYRELLLSDLQRKLD